MSVADDRALLPAQVRAAIATRYFGHRVYYLPRVDSTNRVAADLARSGEPPGSLVLSDFQTRGRGRLQRTWTSPPGCNLLMSLVLRPARSPKELLPLGLVFSVAVAGALSEFAGETLTVNWPNDVMSTKGKLCGVLTECSTRGGRTAYLIAGIGININMRRGDFPPDLRAPGASLSTLTGRAHDRVAVLAAVLSRLEDAYTRYVEEGFTVFIDACSRRLALIGEVVGFKRDGDRREGQVVGIADGGGLVVRLGTGVHIELVDEELIPG